MAKRKANKATQKRSGKPDTSARATRGPSTSRSTAAKRQRQRCFLKAYELHLRNVTLAAETSGISRETHYAWLGEDEAYAEQFAQVNRKMAEDLDALVERRMQRGDRRLKFHQGEAVIDPRTGKVYEEVTYPDHLILRALENLMPEKYGRRVDVTSNGQTVTAPQIIIELADGGDGDG